MSWHFSRALVGEYSAANSLDGEPSVLLKSNPTPQAFLSPGRMKVFSTRSLSGMTFAPLTESRGEELLTWFLEGFHAKTFPQWEKGMVLKEKEAVFGESSQESLARYDPNSHSWKIALCSPDEDSGLFSETWPKWGMMRNGVCSEAQTPDWSTTGRESGYWPTPKSQEPGWTNDKYGDCLVKRWWRLTGIKGRANPAFQEFLMAWPVGWTDLNPLEMDRFQQWQRRHGLSC